MPHYDYDDGTVSLSRGEHYHVSGYVTVKVYVSFDTNYEPDESGWDADLMDAIEFDDWEIENDDELDIEIEDDDWDE